MSSHTIGTCSLCGGRVSVPRMWMGIYPPIPTCDSCGATKKHPHGGTVEMEKPRRVEDIHKEQYANMLGKRRRGDE